MKIAIRASIPSQAARVADRLPVLLGARGGDHVDRVGERGLRRQKPGQRVAHVGGKLGNLEPGGLAGIGAHDPRPPGVGEDADPSAGRQRLAGEQRGDVEKLRESLGANHSGLLEERVDGDVGGREHGAGVGAGRAPTGDGATALDDHDRLAAADAAGQPGEAARIAEGLDVEQRDRGSRVALPVLEEVVGRDVGAVADRGEGGDAEPAVGREVDQGEAEGAALGDEADAGPEAALPARTSR